MGYLSSGNETVDRMGEISITGNIIPHTWYKSILKETGKPYLLAIIILADIVYWYRPVEVRDENDSRIVGWKKKFRGDMLQKSYQQFADELGEAKRSVRDAVSALVELGVVKRELRDVRLNNGLIAYNTMFLSLDIERLIEITYLESDETTLGQNGPKSDQETLRQSGAKLEQESPKASDSAGFVGGGTENCMTPYEKMYEGIQKNVLPHTENGITPYENLQGDIQKNVPPRTEKCMTNTKNNLEINGEITTKNTTEITTQNTSSWPGTCASRKEPIDDEVRSVFNGLSISDENLGKIYDASGKDISRCKDAVAVLKHQTTRIENVVGWLIYAVREGFSLSGHQRYNPPNSFFGFQQNDIDFEALKARIYAN